MSVFIVFKVRIVLIGYLKKIEIDAQIQRRKNSEYVITTLS